MDLFNQEERIDQNESWQDEWLEMPEYNNVKQEKPFITATFKFRNQKDFDTFNELLKTKIYNTNKVFDGMQRKDIKSTWFPLNEKASNYKIV